MAEYKRINKGQSHMFPKTVDVISKVKDYLPEEEKVSWHATTMEHEARKSNFTYSWTYDYEEARAKNKLGLPMSIVFLVKSAFGIGVFTSAYGYAKAGSILGAFCCILVCYITTYGMWLIGKLANIVEEESNEETQIKTYHDLSMACMPPALKNPMKVITIISLGLVNLVVSFFPNNKKDPDRKHSFYREYFRRGASHQPHLYKTDLWGNLLCNHHTFPRARKNQAAGDANFRYLHFNLSLHSRR